MKPGDRVVYHCHTGNDYRGVVKQQISDGLWLVVLDSGARRYIRTEFLEILS
jgi:hypothetical protein